MIRIIVAKDKNDVIAIDGRIPWHYPEDLKRFKKLTMGCVVVAGRKTSETLPNNGLPGRRLITITSEPDEYLCARDEVAINPSDLSWLRWFKEDVWIIGGARIYAAALDAGIVEEIDLTLVPEVDTSMANEVTVFPEDWHDEFFIVKSKWKYENSSLVHQRLTRDI
jgi:dihydrofolate reductase